MPRILKRCSIAMSACFVEETNLSGWHVTDMDGLDNKAKTQLLRYHIGYKDLLTTYSLHLEMTVWSMTSMFFLLGCNYYIFNFF